MTGLCERYNTPLKKVRTEPVTEPGSLERPDTGKVSVNSVAKERVGMNKVHVDMYEAAFQSCAVSLKEQELVVARAAHGLQGILRIRSLNQHLGPASPPCRVLEMEADLPVANPP